MWLNMEHAAVLHGRLPKPRSTNLVPSALRTRKREDFYQTNDHKESSWKPDLFLFLRKLVWRLWMILEKKREKRGALGRIFQRRAINHLVLGGMDLRETLRNWHEKYGYVTEFQKDHKIHQSDCVDVRRKILKIAITRE